MQKKLLRTFTLLLAAAFFAALAGCGDARPTAALADGAADMQSATQPMIALTFDDGPSIHTERLLDLFAKYGYWKSDRPFARYRGAHRARRQ